jgi:hypothetical protein
MTKLMIAAETEKVIRTRARENNQEPKYIGCRTSEKTPSTIKPALPPEAGKTALCAFRTNTAEAVRIKPPMAQRMNPATGTIWMTE